MSGFVDVRKVCEPYGRYAELPGTDEGRIDMTRVHKNVSDMTLAELIEWIRDTGEVAEDIINIEPLKKSYAAMPKTHE